MKILDAVAETNPDKVRYWYKDSDGYWIDLEKGWQWQGCHTVHEWTVADAVASFRWVEPCNCEECKK